MGNPNQRIIVVENNALFDSGKDYFEGFRPADEIDYESRILKNFQIMRRGSPKEPADHPEGNAERSLMFKQPIGYTIILNPSLKKVFAYQRSADIKAYWETRLQGKWSWGFGGHIEPLDGVNGNMIKESVLREVLREEASIDGKIMDLKSLGYVNYDDEVSRVHFCILYGLSTDAKEIHPKDLEIAKVELLSLSELEKMCSNSDVEVEAWSKIALEPLRKLL